VIYNIVGCQLGPTILHLAFRGILMDALVRYNTQNIQKFLNDIEKYSIGMDEWFNRFDGLTQTESNYPPYNVIKTSNTEFRLEIALAGFKKNQITVYTENNKLYVEGTKDVDSNKEYVHQGLANRAFIRSWTISDDVEIKSVKFEDGLLLIDIVKIVPEHQKRKVWF
jgi:molecular chaperone IbpA